MSNRNTPLSKLRYKYLKRISKNKRHTIYALDRNQCVYCGLDMTKYPELMSVDHLTPLAHIMVVCPSSVVNSAGNIVTACMCCNNKLGNRPRHGKMPVFGRFSIATGAYLPLVHLVPTEGAWCKP